MGVYVNLYVAPDVISDHDWSVVYDESLRVLARWPAPPLGMRWHTVAGENVAAYTRECQHEHGWRIVGDASTMQHAETFEFPRTLPRSSACAPDDTTRWPEEDILVRVIAPDGGTGGYNEVFGSKTQGLPYHVLMLAIATLVENRFPGAAMAAGDINWAAARKACRELEVIFGESFAEPVVLSRGRVLARVRDSLPVDALDDFLERYEPHSAAATTLVSEMFALLRDEPGLEPGLQEAMIAADVSAVPQETRVFLEQLVARAREFASSLDSEASAEWRGLSGDDLLRAVAHASRRAAVYITDEAWNQIERSDDEELRLLLHLACISSDRHHYHVHLAVTALFENAALRRSCVRLAA